MKTHKKIIICLTSLAFFSMLFFTYSNRWLIRFAIKNRVPCVLWAKKMTSNQDAINIIKPMLPKNPIILEAGACDGSDTVGLAKIWPQGHVFAFEPVPELYKKVETITNGILNISTYPIALSDKEGTADFFVSSQDTAPNEPSASSSLFAPEKHLEKCPDVHFDRKITVPTTTIDLWAKKNNVDHIDFMWLDTQGSELMIMKNAISLLKTAKYVLVEVEFIEAYKNQPLFSEIKEWMETQGFRLEAFHLACCTWSGDALFMRS